jgi:RNA polymerase sigma factor (sigma-70 family)
MDVPQDLLDLYFRHLSDVPLLTPDQERALAQRVEAGREAEALLAAADPDDGDPEHRARLERQAADGRAAFEHFVSANLRLVVREASRMARRSTLGLDELVQEGNLGLIRAVEKFDWRRGFRFSTYATWWIRQALQRGAAGKERTVRLPAAVHANLLKVRAAQARLLAERGRPPCLDELAEATRLSEAQVRVALAADYSVASLDQPVSDDEHAAELGSLIARASDAPAEEVVERLFTEGVLATARKVLDERQWDVLRRRYGLEGYEPASLQAVGEELGMSRETVRLTEQRALETLRDTFDHAA